MRALQHIDPDQDFFENINHMQLHRRVRAFARVRALLTAAHAGPAGDASTCPFSQSSLTHVLLPLALHPLASEEFKKKDHLSLLQECAAFIGAIAAHLPWSPYFAVIKTLLKQLDRQKAEKEKVLLTALCAVLDAFHFDLRAEAEAPGLVAPDLDDFRAAEGARRAAAEARSRGGRRGGPAASAARVSAAVEAGEEMDDGEGGPDIDAEAEAAAAAAAGTATAAAADEDEEDDDAAAAAPAASAAGKDACAAQTIARAVVNSIMPWVTVFLLKVGTLYLRLLSIGLCPNPCRAAV
jgi:hypothetical protein